MKFTESRNYVRTNRHRLALLCGFLACVHFNSEGLGQTIETGLSEPGLSETGSLNQAVQFAELLSLQWECDTLQVGAKAFLDTELKFADLPEQLRGKPFLRTNFFGTRKVCLRSGDVYVITPSELVTEYSLAPQLKRRGFRLVKSIPEFLAFGDQWEGLSCQVYKKRLEKDERIDLPSSEVVLKSYPTQEGTPPPTRKGRWCVVLANAPQASGEIGDLPRVKGSPFDPPLAQNYSIAAEVPSLAYFIHDPGMVRLANGDFLSFSPCWKRPSRVGKKEGAYVIVTRSRDHGNTWQRLPDLPYAEATPFLAQGKLYLFVQPKQHQDVYFMRSDDDGETWTGPVKVFDGPFWNCQSNIVEKDGQLYWVLDRHHQGTVAIAADLSRDLLDPEAWRMSNFLPPVMTPPEFRPSGTKFHSTAQEQEKFHDWNLEGNVMLVEDRLRIAVRVNPNPGGTPSLAALFDLEDQDGQLKLTYDQHFAWPGGQSKFSIVQDPLTHLFWMACNVSLGPAEKGRAPDRRYLMLYFGHDGQNWMPAGCVAFSPTSSQSFMYPSMVIDGDDLAILSRTGRESGHFHDANLSTFHRIKNFRSLAWN